jgi:hypothetical protein
MDKARAKLLAEDLYTHVFQLLDSEPDSNCQEAGAIATRIEHEFLNHLYPQYVASAYDAALDKALHHAVARYETWCVAELDSDDMDSRVTRAMPLDATYYDEFIAWAGVIVAIVEKDGSVEVLSNH